MAPRRTGLALARRDAEIRRLRAILDALEAGISLFDGDDRLAFANRDFRSLYAPLADALVPGRRFEALLRLAIERGLIPEAAADVEAFVAARLAEHQRPQGPLLRRFPDGRWRRIVEQQLPDGSRLAHSIDVTELVHKEQALAAARADAERERARFADAIAALPDAFVLFDADDRLVVYNERYAQLYAHSAPAIVPGASFESLLRYGLAHGQYPQASGREEAWIAERLHAHRHPREPLLQELPGNRWLRIDERRTRDGGIAGVRTDVTELVRRGQELEALAARLDAANTVLAQLSDTDALTELANRRAFDRRLAEELTRARRHGLPLALVIVDVDHFKRFNDRHGHVAGDDALRRVAAVLRGAAQRPADLAARLGGEEFALLLPHDDAAAATTVAERALAALAQAAIAHGDSPTAPHLTASLGIADLGAVAADAGPEALLDAADAALYRAKAGGRARWAVAPPRPGTA